MFVAVTMGFVSHFFHNMQPGQWRTLDYVFKRPVDSVVRADEKISADRRQFLCRREHQVADAGPIVAVDVTHVIRERMGVHGNFWMRVPAHQFSAFQADRTIAKRGPFRAASHDANMLSHKDVAATLSNPWLHRQPCREIAASSPPAKTMLRRNCGRSRAAGRR